VRGPGMEENTRILGLFTCFNRKNSTLRCLDTLLKQQGVDWAFIAVDDNSPDGTAEALGLYPQVMVIEGNGSSYYSGGMRIAISAAKARCEAEAFDYILLINDDVSFHPGAVGRLVAYLNGENAVMVGATEDSAGRLSYGGIRMRSRFGPKYEWVMSSGRRETCDTFNANCVLIPVEIFRRAPNIDPAYVHSIGDFDYGLEITRLGYPIYVSDFFVGVCDDNPVAGGWRDRSLGVLERIRRKESPKGQPVRMWFHYLRKHYGLVSACLYAANDYIKIFLGR